jgi:mono/diheme cytochrome c family protein
MSAHGVFWAAQTGVTKGPNVLRTCFGLALAGVLGAALSAQPPSSAPNLSAAEKSGRKIFQTRCAMCHVGQDPATELATSNAPPRQTTFGPLLSKAQAANEAALREKIRNGGPRMPGYKHALTDQQIDQVIAFMKTVERPLTKLAAARPGE